MPLLLKPRKKRKTAMKTPSEGRKRFEEKVGERKDKYESATRSGFSDWWSLWYNYTLAQLLEEYETISGIEDPYDRAFQVQEIISEAAKDYRTARIRIEHERITPELEAAIAAVRAT